MIGSYAWPAATLRPGDTVVPKERLLSEAGARRGAVTRLRGRFVDEVGRITRPVFLDPDTTNLPATEAVPRINVLRVAMRGMQVHATVLAAIDRAVPGPTLLELVHGTTVRLAGAYKRPAETGTGWVTGPHTIGDPGAVDAGHALPGVTDLGRLYARMLDGLWPVTARPDETLMEYAARAGAYAAAGRALATAERALRSEQQYARKVDLNREVRELRGHYEELR